MGELVGTIPDVISEMTTIIDDMDQYTQHRGEIGGLDWGIDCFNTAFEGLNPGLALIAGSPNTGKSCLCLDMAWQIAHANTTTKPAYVLYVSLDDSVKEILPRVIAMDQRIPISIVSKPRKYANDPNAMPYLLRREEGIRRLKESVNHFKIIDPVYYPGCDQIEHIEHIVTSHIDELQSFDPNYQLVLFVDNFHDMGTTMNFHNDDNGKYDYISDKLSKLATLYDLPIICTAELRKSNGTRRPVLEDIRETYKIAYESKAVMLVYNEVGIRGESAQVFWEQEGNPEKRPVLEVKVGKNKFSSYKRRMFFEFMPEMSYLRPSTEMAGMRYSGVIGG